jgi:integrase
MVRIEIERGLTVEECILLCNAPKRLDPNVTPYIMKKQLRDEILLRLLYETWARIEELLKVEVQDVDFENCAIYIKHPKGKYYKKTQETKREPRWVYFSEDTKDFIIRYLEGRKTGYLILNNRRGRMTSRTAERIIDHYARLVGIQKARGQSEDGRVLKLVTCKALREAGERHTDVGGADRDVTSKIAGHSVKTKEQYYKKSNFEESREVIRKHHPLFKKDS